jgi:hypothetical protein
MGHPRRIFLSEDGVRGVRPVLSLAQGEANDNAGYHRGG